jgi:uncharacterized DUF497 family protein
MPSLRRGATKFTVHGLSTYHSHPNPGKPKYTANWTCHYTVVTLVIMSSLRFEWDEKKNASNWRRHRVSFDEARTAFLDDNARVIPDPDHSQREERFVLIGLSISLRILVVCHCYRGSDEVIRIISARRADRDEIKQYQWWLK